MASSDWGQLKHPDFTYLARRELWRVRLCVSSRTGEPGYWRAGCGLLDDRVVRLYTRLDRRHATREAAENWVLATAAQLQAALSRQAATWEPGRDHRRWLHPPDAPDGVELRRVGMAYARVERRGRGRWAHQAVLFPGTEYELVRSDWQEEEGTQPAARRLALAEAQWLDRYVRKVLAREGSDVMATIQDLAGSAAEIAAAAERAFADMGTDAPPEPALEELLFSARWELLRAETRIKSGQWDEVLPLLRNVATCIHQASVFSIATGTITKVHCTTLSEVAQRLAKLATTDGARELLRPKE